MDINELIAIVKKKIEKGIIVEKIIIEDKSFLHKNHPGNEKNKYHIKILIDSKELKKMNKIEGNKKIYKLLGDELKNFIHSVQIILS